MTFPPPNSDHLRRCRQDDVDPDWWVESDFDVKDYDTKPEFWAAVARGRHDQTRASMLCYECPLIDLCREEGWNEAYGVWGGLSAKERMMARNRGYLVFSPGRRGDHDAVQRVATMFLAGSSMSEIAANMDLKEEYVIELVRAALNKVRAEREDDLCAMAPVPWTTAGPKYTKHLTSPSGRVCSSDSDQSRPMRESA